MSSRGSILPIRFVIVFGLTVLCSLIAGCILPSISEQRFVPNPFGDIVLSERHRSLDMVVLPPEPIRLSSSASSLLRRTADGKQVLSIAEVAYIDTPLWSGDGRWVAYPLSKHLRICDTRTGVLNTVWQSGYLGSVAWTSDGTLRYVRLPDEVWEYDPANSTNVRLLRLGFDDGDRSRDTVKDRSQMSPSGRFCAAATTNEIIFFDLDRRKVVRSLPNLAFRRGIVFVHDFNWSHNDRFCLFIDLPGKERPPWEEPDHRYRAVLYDLEKGQSSVVDERLPMEGAPAEGRWYGFNKDAWSADDRCFCIRTSWMTKSDRVEKHLLCQVEPWTTVCLEDYFGGEIDDVRFSIRGNFIAVARSTGEQGICVAEIGRTSEGLLRLGPAAKVWSSIPADWFWSPTEPQVMVFTKGRFKALGVQGAVTPASPAARSPWPSP